jgi:thermitase
MTKLKLIIKLSWLFALAAIALMATARLLAASPSGSACIGPHAPGIALVGLRANQLAAPTIASFDVVGTVTGLDVVVVRVPIGQECMAIEALRRDSQVTFAEPDYAAQATDVITPDDPGWLNQWGPAKIQAPPAWGVVTDTSHIVIAIVDSGIQLNHEDLASKVWTNSAEIPNNGVDDDNNGQIDDLYGWHFFHTWNGSAFEAAEDANVQDDFAHGTHVAGIVAADTNNGVGIAGLAWGARLMSVKVLDQFGDGWYSDIAAGIVYAVDNGARLINLSLGGSADSQTLRVAVDYARSHGALVIAATGNSGGAVFYPAAYDPVLAVAATDADDRRAYFSNYGPPVDLAAPGTDIFSTWCHADIIAGTCSGSYYFSKSGTSMAAPHVTGVAALIWSRWPNLTATDVLSRLLDSADDVGEVGPDPYTGWGRINAYQAVTRIDPLPDVWIKVTAPAIGQPMSLLTYTIQYGNRGGAGAQDVWITNSLPAGVIAASSASWSIGTVDTGAGPFTLTVPVTITVGGVTLTNVVNIYPADGNAADSDQAATFAMGIPADASFNASTSDVAVNKTITFTNTSIGTEPLAALWNFGDDTAPVTTTNPIHAYATAGSYTVTLLVTNFYGTDNAQRLITVGDPAHASFAVSLWTAKTNEVVTFTNASTGTTPLSYLWDFGDGVTSTLAAPTHAYTSVGVFSISLTASNLYRIDIQKQSIAIEFYRIALPLFLK